jgi:UDP-2,3-diacylglucosamine hydrolase
VETLFISDLHLSPQRPEKISAFKELLRGPARHAKAVYILGDLFEEFWVGIDDTTPPNQEIINELLELTRHGIPLYIIKGNRELLLDESFSLITGAKILPDRAVIDLEGHSVLLMHGDLLCTSDYKYQRFRRLMINPFVRKLINILPYRVRIWLSHGIRPAMNRSVMQKPENIMDVDQSAVVSVMQQYKALELIHGHTHRPAIHDFNVAGSSFKRIVLGDWYDEAEILVCKNGLRQLKPVAEYLQDYGSAPKPD